jgi:hypothetical protein
MQIKEEESNKHLGERATLTDLIVFESVKLEESQRIPFIVNAYGIK